MGLLSFGMQMFSTPQSSKIASQHHSELRQPRDYRCIGAWMKSLPLPPLLVGQAVFPVSWQSCFHPQQMFLEDRTQSQCGGFDNKGMGPTNSEAGQHQSRLASGTFAQPPYVCLLPLSPKIADCQITALNPSSSIATHAERTVYRSSCK